MTNDIMKNIITELQVWGFVIASIGYVILGIITVSNIIYDLEFENKKITILGVISLIFFLPMTIVQLFPKVMNFLYIKIFKSGISNISNFFKKHQEKFKLTK